MLCADLVPRSHNAALQQTEGVFDCVGMDVAINVHSVTVPNGFVFGAVNLGCNHCFWIGGHFVRDHHVNIGADVFLNIFCQCSRLNIASVKEPEFSTALSNTDDNLFVAVWSIPTSSAASAACRRYSGMPMISENDLRFVFRRRKSCMGILYQEMRKGVMAVSRNAAILQRSPEKAD